MNFPVLSKHDPVQFPSSRLEENNALSFINNGRLIYIGNHDTVQFVVFMPINEWEGM